MPYIPPPPRPPAPPRITPPAPPRIPSFQNQHFQNQQRVQQQQFHHQQQQRVIQQQHQQQQRFHQNIAMENQRRHQQQQQQHQQQLQRQRQAQELQRQQEHLRQDQFRRQQEQQRQEQLRRQQQEHLRNQQSHQDFLRNYQKSTGLNGSTVVNISPGIYVETSESTVPLAEWRSNQVEVALGQLAPVPAAQGAPAAAMSEATVVVTPPTVNGFTQSTPTPTAPPPTMPQASPSIPNGVVPTPSAQQQAPPVSIAPPKPKDPPNNTIALKDGSIIVLKAEDEILFRGPRGVEMVVNCLPLYDPVPMTTEEKKEEEDKSNDSPVKVTVTKDSPIPPKKSENSENVSSPKKSFSLIKARSVNALDTVAAELELHDHDVEMTKSHENVTGTVMSLPPRSWSKSYAKNFTVVVHNHSSPRTLPQSKSQEDLAGAAENSGRTGMTRSATLEGIHAVEEEDVDSSPSKGEVDELSTAGNQSAAPDNQDKSQPESAEVADASHEKMQQSESSTVATPSLEDTVASDRGTDISKQEQEPPAEAAPQPNDVPETETSQAGEDLKKEDQLAEQQKDEESPKSKPEEQVRQENGQADEGKIEHDSKDTEEHSASSAPDKELVSESAGTGNDQLNSHEPLQMRQSEQSPKKGTKKRLRASKSVSPTNDEENYSDEESAGQELQVHYLDQTTMSTLKRSSGSVSFFSRAQTTSPVMVLGAENNADVFVEEITVQNSEEPGPITKPPLVEEAINIASQANSPPNAPPQVMPTSPDSPPQAQAQPSLLQYLVCEVLIPSPLPDPPATIDPSYIERSGWLSKLSHRRGMFGDKWQKRYFVLHRSWLYYFKKYGDSNPRGVIRLLPSGWCRPVAQGTRRMGDAVVKSDNTKIISVLRCVAVHRPPNFVASLCDLLDTDGVAETFRSTTLSVTNSQHLSRTFYMVAPSDTERESWVESITNNIRAYSHSSEALTNACKELKIMLRAVHSTLEPKHIPALLYLIHSKRKALYHATSQDGVASTI